MSASLLSFNLRVYVDRYVRKKDEADNSTLQDIVRIKCVHVHKVFRTVANT